MRQGAQRPAYMDRDWYKAMHGAGRKPSVELSEQQQAFIEYLVDPDPSKPNQADWCAQNGLPVRTGTSWKKKKLFRDEWEKRAYEVYGGPERVNRVVDALFEKAVGGDVRAMEKYLQFVDKFTPKREVINTTRGMEELDDSELAALGENITALRARK